MGVAEVRRTGNSVGARGTAEQLEAGLVREAVGLTLVHVLRGPDEVFPRVRAAARAGHDVVEGCLRPGATIRRCTENPRPCTTAAGLAQSISDTPIEKSARRGGLG